MPSLAPEWSVSQWFNHKGTLKLADLRGKVVVMETFQMLCPGCVSHGLPQAQRIRDTFSKEDVEVLGLHTVFEHHEAMQPHALEAFLHEYKIRFPVGVDRPQPSDRPGSAGTPQTMTEYRLRGTPSLLIFDAKGRLRANYFGQVEDLRLGAEIAALIGEGRQAPSSEGKSGVGEKRPRTTSPGHEVCGTDGSCS